MLPHHKITEPVVGEKPRQEDDSLSNPCTLPSGLSLSPTQDKRRARAPCPSQHPWDPPALAAPCSQSAGCMLPHFLLHLSPVLLQTCAAFPLLSPLQKQGQSAGPARACELFVLRGAAAHSGDLYLISPVCCLPAWGYEGLV